MYVAVIQAMEEGPCVSWQSESGLDQGMRIRDEVCGRRLYYRIPKHVMEGTALNTGSVRMTDGKPQNPLLHAAGIVGRGFLLGVGFSIALGIAVFMGQQVSSHQMAERTELMQSEGGEKDLEKNIALTEVSEVKHDGATVIIGTATNNGKKAAHGIHIQANLFYHDKFVDQYSTYLTGAVQPGKSQYFKISCGCKDTPPAEHDSYKLEVLGGY